MRLRLHCTWIDNSDQLALLLRWSPFPHHVVHWGKSDTLNAKITEKITTLARAHGWPQSMVWHKKPPTPIWRQLNISSHYLLVYPVFLVLAVQKSGKGLVHYLTWSWQNWQMAKIFRTNRQIAHSTNYNFNMCLTASPTGWSCCS